jgi:hypothetical protein
MNTMICNQQVVGSNPTAGSKNSLGFQRDLLITPAFRVTVCDTAIVHYVAVKALRRLFIALWRGRSGVNEGTHIWASHGQC